jgi:hypothetical protein
LRRAFASGPLACLDVPSGIGSASTVYEKTLLYPDLMEPHDWASFSMIDIYPTNKPISNAKRQKKTHRDCHAL